MGWKPDYWSSISGRSKIFFLLHFFQAGPSWNSIWWVTGTLILR